MADRLNIGREVRELTLGSTFAPQNSKTAFHTLKYDFKPASVDTNKVATLDVSSNNQVTVTVPNIDSAGNPSTVFKGNQRKYTKECVIIFDRKTGVMTLEKLHQNIQVKKTRSEQVNKVAPPPPPPQKHPENNTQRTSSKTRVSTGLRKNTIIGFVPRSSPMQQSSPSYTAINHNHKSPQSAPVWNANNGQSTLPSIPLIGLDDDVDIHPQTIVNQQNNHPSTLIDNEFDFPQPLIQSHNQQQQQLYHQQNSIQQQQQQHNNNNNNNNHSGNISGGGGGGMPSLGSGGNLSSSIGTSLEQAAAALEHEIGVLSSSDSSSDSESSGSGSDSDDSDNNSPQKSNVHHHHHHNNNNINNNTNVHNNINNNSNSSHHLQQQQQQQQQPPPYANGSFPALLHDDLQLSESNSSDSDD